jgi:hypothetical protein
LLKVFSKQSNLGSFTGPFASFERNELNHGSEEWRKTRKVAKRNSALKKSPR